MPEPIEVRSIQIKASIMYEHEDPYGQGVSSVVAYVHADQSAAIERIAEEIRGDHSIVVRCSALQVQGRVGKVVEREDGSLFHLTFLEEVRYTQPGKASSDAA